jgi:hypothetical protein
MSVRPAEDADDESATLQDRLEDGRDAPADPEPVQTGDPTMGDPAALLRHLDASGHFHRDSRLGRLYHRGMVSLRENVPTESLHVSVDGNRVTAHVDEVSPLEVRSQGRSRYSLGRTLAHNLVGMTQDLLWLLRGREGDHRSELNCEWVSGSARTPEHGRLLDPTAWSVQLEARVAGALDAARLRTALDEVLRPGSDPLEVVDCRDDEALDAARARLQSTGVPPTRRPPLHAYLARHPAGDVLMLNLNHAAIDGFGALHLLRRIARAYAGGTRAGAPVEFLAVRDLPVRPASRHTTFPARALKRAGQRLRDTVTPPGRLARERPAEHDGYGFHLVALSPADSRRVLDGGRSGDAGDVVVAALHTAIGAWNLQHDTPGGRISVLVPANLRPPEWDEDRIANFSVNARVSTSRRERAHARAAVKAVAAQSRRNTRARTGVALIAGLERAGLVALWAKQSIVVLQPLTGNELVDSTMLCDLGSIDEPPCFGPDAPETVELWFSPPARVPLSLCVGAVTIAGRMHLTFRYPHRLFGADAVRRFADCYVEHLRWMADAVRRTDSG